MWEAVGGKSRNLFLPWYVVHQSSGLPLTSHYGAALPSACEMETIGLVPTWPRSYRGKMSNQKENSWERKTAGPF